MFEDPLLCKCGAETKKSLVGCTDCKVKFFCGLAIWAHHSDVISLPTIAGRESGPQARPDADEMGTDVRDRAAAAGVAFHFKQWGESRPGEGSMGRPGQELAGRILDGTTWNEVPVSAA
ncbi:MAG: hypothetical protein DMG09_28075 [Acidobacteria bacterium]|nr:MAG: hypothetical protein DMG09_28075 [Acidobacteriota bacterium]